MGTYTIKRVLVLASALLLAPCWAVVFTTTEYNVLQGKPFTLEWEDAKGPVEISLVKGDSNNLETIQVIYSGDTGNSYTWTPPDLLLAGTYAFAISDDDSKNYSPLWEYDYEENEPASTSTSSPSPTATSTTRTTMTTVSTTKPLTSTSVTTSPKASASTPTSTPATSSSANDSGDISSSSLPTSSTTATSTSSGSSGSEPTDPSSSPSPSSSTSSTGTQRSGAGGLSTGAKIGIGIGAGLGGLGLASVALFLVFRRGKAVGQRAVVAGYTGNQEESKAELGGDPGPRAELGGQGIAEMQSGHDGWRGQPSELDASPRSYRGGADMSKI
ncbi:hypothetical protein F5B21DRAFT_332165 [Xylaria acuta]|nr:hypothetical protein F5B21DRAFT_332165 [Xylaria acuta]